MPENKVMFCYIPLVACFAKRLVIALLLFVSTSSALAQTHTGIAKGQVKDSVHHYVLPAATVSIYIVATGKLVNFQLSNNFGRVLFNKLPVGVLLRAIATNVGYAPASKEFTIPPESGEIDLDIFPMNRQAVGLQGVTIVGTPPPVQMRGDTLEFNADAFKLDSNAVVEDMLKKLPGVTIWNDGVITVNGKKVDKLLVEGKPFFDIRGKIALQNLPKGAVQQVQVYDVKSQTDSTDIKTNMNILLKKDQQDGYFGKVGASLGTTRRYDANGMISYFSPTDQISVVGALNNVNKSAANANTLVEINSFKGEGIGNNYHSDFTQPGTLVFKAAGFTALHDFGKKLEKGIDTNDLKVEYFMTDNRAMVNQQLNTTLLFGTDGHLSQTTASAVSSGNNEQAFRAAYEKNFVHSKLHTDYTLLHTSFHSNSTLRMESAGDSAADRSERIDDQDTKNTATSQTGTIDFQTQRYNDFAVHKNRSLNMSLHYAFKLGQSNEDKNRISRFTTTDTTQRQQFNRQYGTSATMATHSLESDFYNILPLLSNKQTFPQIDFKNVLAYDQTKQTDAVSDFSETSQQYALNNQLSNHLNTRIVEDRPGLNFTRSRKFILTNRYANTWTINFFAQGQFYNMTNTARQQFQNINRAYFYFIPSAGLQYRNYQTGEFRKTYALRYNTSVTYPTLQQLAPLVDDANVTYLSYGNIHLKPAYVHDVLFSYDYNNVAAKNPFNGSLQAKMGLTAHFITDSSYFDQLGRSVSYPINVEGERHASVDGSLQKAFKRNGHQWQVAGKSSFNYTQNKSSLNGQFYEVRQHAWLASADLTYEYKSLTAQVGETFSYQQLNRATISTYTYKNWKTYGYIAWTMTRGLFAKSGIDFNKYRATNTHNIYFTIWNTDVGYRFLKGNNLEVKLSGLDLLHQHKNVINTITDNSITTGTVNVLQQYFLFTLAYYPRRFGLHKKDQ
ncbi:hypothetical protein GA0116948_10873 [Chitinophaga costaii]|uniref:Outer membrane protein beta-barrel family protein n=1 Tax=Chitinophaga costaii TaxID=1335309 RepID=A0A1C4EFK3_9BACT|nr:hypothetical protein [Chitinophaga costaii]PUZ23858.1 hypothetical protein DCM91_13775 [Chitinophaga costaii]SCC42355.1 hypothetical protein GA0116948_10873 [Chitinophaga costaii]